VAKVSSSREMVPIAYSHLKAQGAKVTVKAVQEYIFDRTNVTASPNLINDELRKLREDKEGETAGRAEVHADRISREMSPGDPLSPEQLNDEPEHNRDSVDYKAKYFELAVQHQASEEILKIYKREITTLRDTVRKQSESLARLNTYFAEQIREMAKEASVSMLKTVEDLHQQISEMQVAREADQEQWKGLRAFLMSETDRIRETETAKTQLMSRKIADLEMMVTHLTQLKNQAQDEASRLKMQIADKG